MIVKISELKNNMSVIYKINYKDGRFYIGLTDDLKRRMSEHISAWKKMNYKKIQDCDKAIYEQGGIDEVEILEFAPIEKLEEREIYWISYYNAYHSDLGYNNSPGGYNGGSGVDNPKSIFSKEQVLDIRKRRFFGERKKDVYKDYSNYSFGTFEKIWLGRGYNNIGHEYIIQPNTISRQEYSHNANNGLKNGKSKCNKEQILEIRYRYDNGEPINLIAKDFNHISKSTVRRIALRESYKDVL